MWGFYHAEVVPINPVNRDVNVVCISFTGVDSVGTVPSSLLTYAAGVALQPDLIINAGTAGAFQVIFYFLH